MNKIEQAVYHALYQGFLNIDEEIQIPRLEGEALYNVFFKLRLDHPEIFWATGYKYKYYNDSPNLIFVPEYLFEKAKIKEHQKAMTARVEKITREAKTFSQWDKEKYIHDFLCENVHYDKLKKPYSHEIIGPLGHGVGAVSYTHLEAYAKEIKISLTRKEKGILEYLLLNLGRPVSQEELMEHVWDASVDSFSGAIRVHMSSLRRKLKACLLYTSRSG